MDEETKQKLLEELRKEYRVELKPLKEAKFSIGDILTKYNDKILDNIGKKEYHYRYRESLDMAIRRIMCLHYGVWNTKDIPVDKRVKFREDAEKFIQDFILNGKEI